MEKLLTLLSILIISGTIIPNVIAVTLIEEEEIEDEVFNLGTENNLRNLTRYKRFGEYDDIPDVSAQLRSILAAYLISENEKGTGTKLTKADFRLDLDVRVKEAQEVIANGVIVGLPQLVANDSTIVTNNDDYEQKISSSEITLKTTTTESVTLGNTFEVSGEVEIPLIKTKGKIGMKFSKSRTTTSTKSEEITKKLPSQQVMLQPHSSRKVVSELYAYDVIHKYLVSFELDENSRYTIEYLNVPWPYININSHKRTPYLKYDLEDYRRSTDRRYPTAIYCGTIPCIEFKDNKVYLKYFPLEVRTVTTELRSFIDKIDEKETKDV